MTGWLMVRTADVSFPDDDCAVMKAHIERLARNTAYGGSIEVVFHTPYPEPDNAVSEKTYNAQIRVKWKFECPFPPTDQVWNDLVMNAMVDRKKGWIARDVPTPSHGHGMSPFRRAIKGTSQIISQEQDVDGSKRLVQRFSPWGCDGSS
ncbi:hypothetical protein EYZ11_006773 [Aspergillus tanneri]|uniref:Uncharacterized protein n=1 Tax=Aspergillus tanneri TaxID=1220188 RepID=A0A4S3JEK7_9EURO|nr:hypothetical protein EYZ11_006773 [Aspergillus tanneri]